MLPRVIVHNGISVDGRMDWFTGDIGLYYGLAAQLGAEAMLSGSDTILAAFTSEEASEQADDVAGPPQDESEDRQQLLVIVDSRGRVRNLHQIRRTPYWQDVVAMCSKATPPAHLAYLDDHQIEYILAGEERVELRAALTELRARYGIETVRVDSGGVLNGVLLKAGLVNEVSVLIGPALVGGTSPRSLFVAHDLDSAEEVIPLNLTHVADVQDGNVWLRYEVAQ